MKNLMPKVLVIMLMLISAQLIAQDKIYKKNQEVVLCKVLELGEEYVKYTMEETGSLVYEMDLLRVSKIVFASGREVVITDKEEDPEMYYGTQKNIVKLGLLSPVTGALNFSYEHSIRPGASIEMGLGVIGLGFKDLVYTNGAGAHFDVGYKFIVRPNSRARGTTYRHLLRGFYFKPKVSMAVYERDFDVVNSSPTNVGYSIERGNVFAGALTLDLGWQWVISERFAVNIFGGIGYGFDNVDGSDFGYPTESYDSPQYHYGFTVGGNVPLSFSGGFRVGYAF